MEKKPLISYILPAYQAESFIYNKLDLFYSFCAESEYSSEIIIVNDGSSDRTNEIIKTFINNRGDRQKNHFVKYVNLPQNRGKGNAVKSGFEASVGQYIIFIDSDLPYSFKNIGDVVHALVEDRANFAIANRMHKDSVYKIRSENLSYIYVRHTAGRIYNKLIQLFTQLKFEDTQAGLKGFDRDTAALVFSRMTIEGFSFDIDLLVCARENNKDIHTVPVELNYDSEISTINFVRQIFIMTLGLFRIYLKRLSGYYKK